MTARRKKKLASVILDLLRTAAKETSLPAGKIYDPSRRHDPQSILARNTRKRIWAELHLARQTPTLIIAEAFRVEASNVRHAIARQKQSHQPHNHHAC